MTTTIIVTVREDGPDFHGAVAHVAISGNGSPEQFRVAMETARVEAGRNLGRVARVPSAQRMLVRSDAELTADD